MITIVPIQALIVAPTSSLITDAIKHKGNTRFDGDSMYGLAQIDNQLYTVRSDQNADQTAFYDDKTTPIYDGPFTFASTWVNFWPMGNTRQSCSSINKKHKTFRAPNFYHGRLPCLLPAQSQLLDLCMHRVVAN